MQMPRTPLQCALSSLYSNEKRKRAGLLFNNYADFDVGVEQHRRRL